MTNSKRVGIITYDFNHLKTEQVLQKILCKNYHLTIYALPFVERPKRNPILMHRPEQSDGCHPEILARQHGIDYQKCDSDLDIDGSDIYLVTGAGILSSGCVQGKTIVNAHPGVIPASRGLDAFKWAIYDGVPRWKFIALD